jgi:hypothetical protein
MHHSMLCTELATGWSERAQKCKTLLKPDVPARSIIQLACAAQQQEICGAPPVKVAELPRKRTRHGLMMFSA